MLLCVLAIPNNALSATYSTTAKIRIVKPITFQEISQLNFGVVEYSTTDKYVEILPTGTIGAGTTASFMNSGSISSTKVKIMGSDNSNVGITATYIGNETNFSIEEMKAEYEGAGNGELFAGMSNLTTTSAGKELSFGAKLKINGNTPEGDYQPEILLSVNYE